jgi:hypothetical protein
MSSSALPGSLNASSRSSSDVARVQPVDAEVAQVACVHPQVGDGAALTTVRRYLDLAPGARPHLSVRWGAPLGEFERIAEAHPVFRVDPAEPD